MQIQEITYPIAAPQHPACPIRRVNKESWANSTDKNLSRASATKIVALLALEKGWATIDRQEGGIRYCVRNHLNKVVCLYHYHDVATFFWPDIFCAQ